MDHGEYEVANQLARRAQRGDEDSLVQLWTRLGPVRNGVTGRFWNIPGMNKEDLDQELFLSFAGRALHDWDPSMMGIIGFARLTLYRHAITILKRSKGNRESPNWRTRTVEARGVMECMEDDNEDMGQEDLEALNPLEAVLYSEKKEALRAILSEHCTKLEYRVVEQYLDGMSYVEIAEKCKLPIKSVDNALGRIKGKMSRLKNLGDLLD